MASALAKLGSLDRRWIYLFIALAVVIPLLLKTEFPVATTPIVQNIFDEIETLPPGSKVLLTADFGPSTEPENQPMLEAVARHCLHKGHKLYVLTIWATGTAMINNMIAQVIDTNFPNVVEGEDWVNFGYKAGNQGVINSAYSDIVAAFPTDVGGRDTRTIPMMQGVKRLEDMNLIVAIGSGFPGVKEWIQFGGDPAGVRTAGGVTAVEAPLLYPYYPGQLLGLMGGLQGAAEYEAALVAKYPEYESVSKKAIGFMAPQTVAHIVIILFIIIGNIAYFASDRKKPRLGVKS